MWGRSILVFGLGVLCLTLGLWGWGATAASAPKAAHRTPVTVVVPSTTTTTDPPAPAPEPTPVAPPVTAVPTAPIAAPGPAATCGDGYAIPGSIVYTESRCDPNAYNATGCSGRGCIGLYQLDQGHFAAVSPWNGNVSGTCADLNPQSQADQRTCAERLGPSAWGH